MVGLNNIDFIDKGIKENPHKKLDDLDLAAVKKAFFLALPVG